MIPDRMILWAAGIIAAFGVLMVFDASAVSAALRHKFDNPVFFLERQFLWFLVGFFAMIIASRIPLHKFEHLVLPVTLFMLVLLILVLIPGVGHSAGGARRWLRFGPLSVQPGEFMRLTLAIYLARLLSVKSDSINNFRKTFLPAIIVTSATVLLLAAQPKYGTSLIIVILAGILLFIAGIPLIQLSTALGFSTAFLLFAVFRVGYIQDRISAWLHPAEHARDAGFQMIQSLIAIGSGGLSGTGLGQGRQKMFYLPEAHTDMILPVISEELGLIGSICVLSFFGIILFRGLHIAKNTDYQFGKILAVGLTMSICIPAALNILVAIGLFPITGVALPLISFGGTALVTEMTALGLLAGIPAWSKKREIDIYAFA
ncbi:putative lipid II flippase FtsW [bacterium]|nr:putative lipid II flippase FtsW [bacterium]